MEGIKNLHQRIIEARKLIPEVKKDKKGDYYPYASASAVYRPAREAMDKAGISYLVFLKQTHFSPHKTKEGAEHYFVKVETLHQLINADDPNDKIEITWEGHAIDQGEKGIGKAFTYANKTFLASQFLIPIDSEDPDAEQERSGGNSIVTGIKDISIYRKGVGKDRKQYTIWNILTADGEAFQTFKAHVKDAAEAARTSMQLVEIVYRKDKYGMQIEKINPVETGEK